MAEVVAILGTAVIAAVVAKVAGKGPAHVMAAVGIGWWLSWLACLSRCGGTTRLAGRLARPAAMARRVTVIDERISGDVDWSDHSVPSRAGCGGDGDRPRYLRRLRPLGHGCRYGLEPTVFP